MDDKDTASAEKAFSEAVEAAQSGEKNIAPVEAQETAASSKTAPAKPKPAAKKPAAKKAASPTTTAAGSKKAGSAKKPAAPATSKIDQAVAAVTKQPKRRAPTKKTTANKPAKPVKAKTPATTPAPKKVEKTMASKTNKFDLMATLNDTLNEAKAKSEAAYQDAYKKGSELYAESKEMTKANTDALVASGKVVVEGLKTAGSSSVTESREMVNTIAEDMKSFAAVKSPAELFELQGKLAARNYDATMAFASKSASSLKDFASKAFAPISAQAKANYEAVRKMAD